jgi:uncharacterized protein (TIGR00106 family)
MAIVEVSVVPIGVAGTSLSGYVKQALSVLRQSGLRYELTAMGTIIDGNLDEIWSVLRRMHESCFLPQVGRVLTQIKVDDRRDRESTPEQKVQSVLDKMVTGVRE